MSDEFGGPVFSEVTVAFAWDMSDDPAARLPGTAWQTVAVAEQNHWRHPMVNEPALRPGPGACEPAEKHWAVSGRTMSATSIG